jgi:inosine-uridine nucleoside N-ribohydrolase
VIIQNLYGQEQKPQIPVIFDTDIGEDIEDTWALAFLLCSPELDLRMVTTSFNDTTAKAQIAAKFLHRLGKGDTPVGIGINTGKFKGYQYPWAEHFALEDYPGDVATDGVGAMIDLIHYATETITIIVTGPCTNIAEMLRREPGIVNKINIVASMGSIFKGYDNISTPDSEYNIRKDTNAASAMFQADWKITLSPLDVTGLISVRGKEYQRLLEFITLVPRTEDEYSVDELVELETLHDEGREIEAHEPKIPYTMPLSRKPIHAVIYSLLESYRVWLDESGSRIPPDARSTILYDTVAVYLAFSQEYLEMKPLNISVDFTGHTRVRATGKQVLTALNWRSDLDFQTFQRMIVSRLVAGIPKKLEEEEAEKKQKLRFQRIGGTTP